MICNILKFADEASTSAIRPESNACYLAVKSMRSAMADPAWSQVIFTQIDAARRVSENGRQLSLAISDNCRMTNIELPRWAADKLGLHLADPNFRTDWNLVLG